MYKIGAKFVNSWQGPVSSGLVLRCYYSSLVGLFFVVVFFVVFVFKIIFNGTS